MEKKRVITIFKDPNGPYLKSLIDGAKESPEQRSIKFFQERRKLEIFMGHNRPAATRRKITIRKAEWI